MIVYKITYPLLECRSWLPFVLFFVCDKEVMPDLSSDRLYIMCLLLIYVIGNHHDRYVFLIVEAQLLNAALPYWNPCFVWDPSATHPPPSTPTKPHPYVITLFADATIIPFTLSADATITS